MNNELMNKKQRIESKTHYAIWHVSVHHFMNLNWTTVSLASVVCTHWRPTFTQVCRHDA